MAHKTGSRRIIGLDVIKTLAIALVIMVHLKYYSNGRFGTGILENTLFRFTALGVPLMFMVNGDLLFSRPLNLEKHMRKVARLVLVILTWRVISLFLMCAIVHVGPFSYGMTGFASYLFGWEYADVPLGHFWFIYVLVALYLLFPVLRVAFDSPDGKRVLVFFAGASLIVSFGIKHLGDIWGAIATAHGWSAIEFSALYSKWLFTSYGYVLVYFILGAFATQWICWLHERLGSRYRLTLMAACLLSLAITVTLSDHIAKSNSDVFVLIMSVSVYALLRDIRPLPAAVTGVFQNVGTNTLGVYLLHMFPLIALRDYAPAFFPQTYGFATLLVIVLLILAICDIVSTMCRRVPVIGNLFKL